MKKTYNLDYKKGDWLVECDICGKALYHSQARHTWNNLLVCPEDYDPKDPLDFPPKIRKERVIPGKEIRLEKPEVTVSGYIRPGTWASFKWRTWKTINNTTWANWNTAL